MLDKVGVARRKAVVDGSQTTLIATSTMWKFMVTAMDDDDLELSVG